MYKHSPHRYNPNTCIREFEIALHAPLNIDLMGLSDNSKNRLEGKIFQTKFNTKCFLPIFSVLSPAIGDFHELQTDLS